MPIPEGIPAIGIEDSIETLLAHEHVVSNGLYLATLCLTVTALCSAAVTRVDLTIRAPASLAPAIERHTLRAAAEGTVDRVLVTLGSVVRPGDTVLVLASGAAEGARSAAVAAVTTQLKRRDDLKVLLAAGWDSSGRPSWDESALRLEQSRASASAAITEWRQGTLQVFRAEGRRNREAQLAARGFATPADLETAQQELANAHEERALARQRQHAAWATELSDAERQVAELTRDVAVRTTEREARVIRAPVGGGVEELAPLSAGSEVRAGDHIATISPEGELMAEVFVAPRDVVYLRVGMPARLLVEGYDAQEWGGLDATVTSIGSDYILLDGHPVFRVRARPLRTDLRRADGATARISKGLRCQARFLLGKRRLLDIVRRRGREWLDPVSAGER